MRRTAALIISILLLIILAFAHDGTAYVFDFDPPWLTRLPMVMR